MEYNSGRRSPGHTSLRRRDSPFHAESLQCKRGVIREGVLRLPLTSRRMVLAACARECTEILEREIAHDDQLMLLRKSKGLIAYCRAGAMAMSESPAAGFLRARPIFVARVSVRKGDRGTEVVFRALAGVPSLFGALVLAIAFFATPVQIARVALWPSTPCQDKIAALILVPASLGMGVWAMRFLVKRACKQIELLYRPLTGLRPSDKGRQGI